MPVFGATPSRRPLANGTVRFTTARRAVPAFRRASCKGQRMTALPESGRRSALLRPAIVLSTEEDACTVIMQEQRVVVPYAEFFRGRGSSAWLLVTWLLSALRSAPRQLLSGGGSTP